MTEWESMKPFIALWDGLRIGGIIVMIITAGTISKYFPRLVRAIERIVELAEKE